MADNVSQSRFGMSQYYNRDGVFNNLDPRTRLVAVILWLSILTATASVWGLLCGLVIILVLLYVSGTPMEIIARRILRPMVFILILAAVQILFSPADSRLPVLFDWGPILVNGAGIMRAVKLILRFASLYLLLNWLTVVLSSTDIIRALSQLLRPLDRLKIRTHDFVLLVQVALHFLPLLSAELDRIVKAQTSRGAEWGVRQGRIIQRAQQTFPILLPLFITSLRRAENLAQAIEARGYGAGPRTSMITLIYSWLDGLAYAVISAVCLLVWFV